MNRRHPIDDLFRSRLEDYGQDAPMHLWDSIERRREKKRRGPLALWLLPVVAAGVVGFGVYLMRSPSPVNLGSFPIPMMAENAAAAISNPLQEQPTSEKNTTPAIAAVMPGKITIPKSGPVSISDAGAPGSAAAVQAPEVMDEIHASGVTEAPLVEKTAWTTAELPGVGLAALNYENKDLWKGLFPPDPQCARFSTGNWYHYVDLTLSAGFASRNLEVLDSEYEGYLQQRENTEKTKYAIGAGARLSVVSDIGVAVRAGINYTRITEAFDYLNENEVRITITNVYGPTGEVIRTDTTYVSGTRRKVTPNQYQLIEVPLSIGYDLHRPKFDLLLSAGVRINLLFLPKGAFLSPDDLMPVNFSYNRADAYPAFKKRLETGWFVSAGLAYKWRPDFHFLFEPYLSYYPDSFTNPGYPVSQNYWLAGASIGIRKRL